MKFTSILLFSVICLAACDRGHSPRLPKGEIRAAEYEVLSAWVNSKFTNAAPSSKDVSRIVILDTTSGDPHLQWGDNGRPIPWKKEDQSLRQKDPTLQESTTERYGTLNLRPAFLRHSLPCALHCEVVDSAQLEPFFKRGGTSWLGYYKRFPGSQGVLTFSRVGFSVDGNQALFYVSNICGGLCGGGDYIVMEKHNGLWTIQKEISMWVS